MQWAREKSDHDYGHEGEAHRHHPPRQREHENGDESPENHLHKPYHQKVGTKDLEQKRKKVVATRRINPLVGLVFTLSGLPTMMRWG